MKKKPISSAFDQYLAQQAQYPDSPYRQFFNTFSLTFILKNLKGKKREKFLQLLEQEKFIEVLELIGNNLPDFPQKFQAAFKKEIERIKKQAENASSPGGPAQPDRGGISNRNYDRRKTNTNGGHRG